MNKLNAVIFDLDGVICFTDKYHFQAWKKLADEEGIYFDEEINDRLRGVSRMDSLDIILERAFREYTQEEKTQMAARKNESYVHLLDQMSPADLSVEVKDTLDELRKRGYKLAIGSSSKNTKKILKQIGLGDYFDAISDGTNITKSKPDPEVFLKAAEMLGEKPENCMVVEDALAGIEAMKKRLGYVSKDRDVESLCLNASIEDNISIAGMSEFAIKDFLVLKNREKKYVDNQIKELSIKCAGREQSVSQLSGGNKQKVVFGKWIGCGSEIIILDCPTRGVDIGVKQAMYQLMVKLKNEGKSILMISEELPELIGMSDRVLIMKDGEITMEFERSENLSDSQIIEYMI